MFPRRLPGLTNEESNNIRGVRGNTKRDIIPLAKLPRGKYSTLQHSGIQGLLQPKTPYTNKITIIPKKINPLLSQVFISLLSI